ncbi:MULTISPECIES: zinc ribbon domain-containing protein YjdM [unclassified Staphylococcus]|uniref:zinc ribbon domain-containing protein YjdM n=1 Tax=unclassified Staphylococcus TaxID=91994 RepID=UPI0021CEB65A|nr:MULTISPECIES: zinc ribbon domain-containing protein YjdM [unclassified Staphylococcus]UXR78216.1 zinc ribbon domain-containing protein YjdM [Staphylococcus sp. IVB6227]UXR82380.1 zinc ribbon domain-containing protein YjdM [Staphylococcus sp. IVB6214]
MTTALPNCPSCGSEYTYEDGALYVCPMCAHEWTAESVAEAEEAAIVRDANGNILQDGDTVTVIRDLKVKGSSNAIKQGTKVKNIKLVDPEDGHDIDCKIPGFGQIGLKSEVVKKIN